MEFPKPFCRTHPAGTPTAVKFSACCSNNSRQHSCNSSRIKNRSNKINNRNSNTSNTSNSDSSRHMLKKEHGYKPSSNNLSEDQSMWLPLSICLLATEFVLIFAIFLLLILRVVVIVVAEVFSTYPYSHYYSFCLYSQAHSNLLPKQFALRPGNGSNSSSSSFLDTSTCFRDGNSALRFSSQACVGEALGRVWWIVLKIPAKLQ